MESKKITQLATEVAPLLDDLTFIGDPITGQLKKVTLNQIAYIFGAGSAWGTITGTLSNQTDLQAALNLKANDNEVVKLTGNQTINGIKTFNNIVLSGFPVVATALVYSKGGSINPLLLGSTKNMTYAETGSNNIVVEDELSKAKLIFDNSVQTYTFPAATGTIALTSDLTGGTVTSVAALTIGTSGTDLSSTVATSTTTPVITLNVPTASAANRGALSSADWTTFNNKQNAITLTTTGTSGVSTLIGSTLNIPNYSTDLSGYVPYTGATANVNLGTFDLTADVITGATGSFASSGGSDTFAINHSSGAGIALNITKGGNGEGLYINKTSGSGNAATIIGTLNATTLVKSGGTSSQYLMADGSVSTLTNPVTGTGTTNTLPKFTGTSAIGDSNITDTGSLITLGSNSFVNGLFGIGSTPVGSSSIFYISNNITGGTACNGVYLLTNVLSDVTSQARGFVSNIGTQTATFTLSNLTHYRAEQGIFRGSSVVTTQVGYLASDSIIGATNNYAFQGSIPSGTNRWNLYMNGTANNYIAGSLGIGTTSLTGYTVRLSKNITGSTASFAVRNEGVVQSDVTADAIGFRNDSNTATAAFTLVNYWHFWARQGSIGAGSAITNQYGYVVDGNMIGATNNFAFQGNIPSGTNRWNLYMAGTAANYMAGNLGIGTSTSFAQLHVQAASNTRSIIQVVGTEALGDNAGLYFKSAINFADAYIKSAILFRNNGTGGGRGDLIFATNSSSTSVNVSVSDARLIVTSLGNIGINTITPDASAQLQVDSTTRGFLPPRVTATQKAAIATPATGLMVYQTNGVEGVYVYSGGSWKSLTMV